MSYDFSTIIKGIIASIGETITYKGTNYTCSISTHNDTAKVALYGVLDDNEIRVFLSDTISPRPASGEDFIADGITYKISTVIHDGFGVLVLKGRNDTEIS